jgi:hypothetical protein
MLHGKEKIKGGRKGEKKLKKKYIISGKGINLRL